jgi:hypothetical protein
MKVGQSDGQVSTSQAAQQVIEQALQGDSSGAKISIDVFFSASEKRTLLNADGSVAEEPRVDVKNHTWTFERDFGFLNTQARYIEPSYWEISDLK